MSITKEIRESLFCDRCKNCKLLVWDKDAAKMEKLTGRGYVNAFYRPGEPNPEAYFVVRCLWLKDNILDAARLSNCEGRQDY